LGKILQKIFRLLLHRYVEDQQAPGILQKKNLSSNILNFRHLHAFLQRHFSSILPILPSLQNKGLEALLPVLSKKNNVISHVKHTKKRK
jgi:hypothetical protein